MNNKEIINKWFRLLVDSIYKYDDTIRIEDIYELVEDMDSIDIVNTYYMKGNVEYRIKSWVDYKSETSIENILRNRGLGYSFKPEPQYNAYWVTLNKNVVRIKEYCEIIILEIIKDNNITETITISDYKKLAMYIDKLMVNMENEIKVDIERWMYERDKYPMIKTAKCGIGESSLGYYFTYEPIVEIDGKDIPIKDGDILVLENDKVVQVYKN